MRLFLILSSIGCSLIAGAQYNSFINLGIEDGLAQSQVNYVHQDASGYLWVATASGLSRYDGSSVVNFYKSDGLVDNVVTHIIEGTDGKLFIGGAGGVTVFHKGRFSAYPFPKSIEDSRVQFMQFSNDSALWIGTNRDGYFSFSPRSGSYSVPILGQGRNIRWFNISSGLVAGRDGLFLRGELIEPLFSDVSVSDVIQDGETLWVSSLGDGIFKYDGKWERVPYSDEDHAFYRDMFLASSGALWFVGPEGAVKYEDGNWDEFNSSNGLDYVNIRHVNEDREGNIWLASNGQGIFRFTGELFTTYSQGNPLFSDIMLSAVARNGDLFLGMFDERFQVLSASGEVGLVDGFPQTDVWCTLLDSEQTIWAGTSTGLFRSEPGKGFEEMFSEELPSARITALHEDGYGNIWVGHREGASVIYSDKEIQNYIDETGFEGKRIRSINEAKDGAIWVGAQSGLYRIEEEWILRLGEEQGLNDNTIYSIQDDLYGRLWIGAKSGLHILKDDSVLQVMISGRVDANNINFLHSSDAGYLYIGTNQGLFVTEVAEDVSALEFRHYGIDDGIPGLECNLNAVFQEEHGDIWFGTNKGVVRFSESEMIDYDSPVVPQLHITAVKLFAELFDLESRSEGSELETGMPDNLVFQPEENHITFDFKGVRLREPGSVKYQYILEGVDESWLPPSTSNSVTYSSLGFGKYCFKVRCVNSAGEVLGHPEKMDFRILPPIYLRWWALGIETFLIIGIVYMIFSWRRQVRMRKNNMIELTYRNRMQSLEQQSLNSSMNRHFIFNSLNAIQFYINREDKRSANRYLSSFAKLIRKNLDSTATTWVSLKDELERLELYLSLEHMRFTEKFEYSIDIDPGIDVEKVKVPAMMLQPYVENSIWHGILPKPEAGAVKVQVERLEERMRIRIEDDGIGIDESQRSKNGGLPDHESKGMDITHHRLRLYGEMTGTDFEVSGPYQVENDGVVMGTRIDLFIPMVN